MSTLNKFIIFKCDTCNRQSEILIDSKSIDPIRCNITLKCRGKLSRIGESSAKKFLFTPPISGLQNFIPRGTVTSNQTTAIIDPIIPINTSNNGILSMALLKQTINPKVDGRIIEQVPLIVAAGEHPVHLAITSNNKNLYVANTGEQTLSQFSIGSTGQLTKLANNIQVSIAGIVQYVVVSPDSKFVYSSSTGAIAILSRDISNGLLSYKDTIYDDLTVGFSLIISTDGTKLYSANMQVNSITVFDIDQITGLLTLSARVITVGNPYWLTISKDNRFLYSCDFVNSGIEIFDIISNPFLTPFVPGSKFIQSIISNDGLFLYAISREDNTLYQYQIDIVTGNLTEIGIINVGYFVGGVVSIEISPDDKSVYVISQVDYKIFLFDRDLFSGLLTPKIVPSIDIRGSLNSYPNFIKMTSDGKYLYTANIGNIDVSQYVITNESSHNYSVLDALGNSINVNNDIPISQKLPRNIRVFLNIFPISPSVLQSSNFLYVRSGSTDNVVGPDDSQDSKTLRFSINNKIKVFVNGIEMVEGVSLTGDYTRNITNQEIIFNKPIILQNNIIEISVYNDLTLNVTDNSIIGLQFNVLDPEVYTFNPNDPNTSNNLIELNSSAWGNFNAVTFNDIGTRYIVHCVDTSALIKDYSYGVKNIHILASDIITNAGNLVNGKTYEIVSIGTAGTSSILTDFTLYGAPDNKTGTLFKCNTTVAAKDIVAGVHYKISSVGTTDWTSVGAYSNTIGGDFVAVALTSGSLLAGNGTVEIIGTHDLGTGIAIEAIELLNSEVKLLIANDPYNFKDKELNAYLDGSIIDSAFFLSYKQDSTGIYKLSTSKANFKQLSNPLIPYDNITFPANITNNQNAAASSISLFKNKYVLGPT